MSASALRCAGVALYSVYAAIARAGDACRWRGTARLQRGRRYERPYTQRRRSTQQRKVMRRALCCYGSERSVMNARRVWQGDACNEKMRYVKVPARGTCAARQQEAQKYVATFTCIGHHRA